MIGRFLTYLAVIFALCVVWPEGASASVPCDTVTVKHTVTGKFGVKAVQSHTRTKCSVKIVGPLADSLDGEVKLWFQRAMLTYGKQPNCGNEIRVVPHHSVQPYKEYADAVPATCQVWLTPRFFSEQALIAPFAWCQIIVHEYAHLLGYRHQTTNPWDVMFDPQPNNDLRAGGWWTQGVVPACNYGGY